MNKIKKYGNYDRQIVGFSVAKIPIKSYNKDISKMIESKEFREDLYYRINVIPIEVPSLKERKDDIEHKIIVVPTSVNITKEEIEKTIHFIEKYYKHKLII